MELFFGVEKDKFYSEVPVSIEDKSETDVKLMSTVWHISWTFTDKPYQCGVNRTGKCVFTHKAGKRFDGKVYIRLSLDEWKSNDSLLTSGEINTRNSEKNSSQIYMLSEKMETPVFGAYQKNASRGVLLYGPRNTSKGFTGFLFNEKKNNNENRKGTFILFEAPGTRQIDFKDSSTLFLSDDKHGRYKTGDLVELGFVIYDFPCENTDELLLAYTKTRENVIFNGG